MPGARAECHVWLPYMYVVVLVAKIYAHSADLLFFRAKGGLHTQSLHTHDDGGGDQRVVGAKSSSQSLRVWRQWQRRQQLHAACLLSRCEAADHGSQRHYRRHRGALRLLLYFCSTPRCTFREATLCKVFVSLRVRGREKDDDLFPFFAMLRKMIAKIMSYHSLHPHPSLLLLQSVAKLHTKILETFCCVFAKNRNPLANADPTASK